jgi:asparagine synthase (glutamine-hydrolysing)
MIRVPGNVRLLAFAEFSHGPVPRWLDGAARVHGLVPTACVSASIAGNGIPETAHRDTLPVPPVAPFLLAADIFLHNRPELAEKLRLPARTADNDLVVAAYRKWGEASPEHLDGEFSFALFDPAMGIVFCARDRFAHRALLYWSESDRFALASDVEDLLAVPGIRRELNRTLFARIDLPDGPETDDRETFHAGIWAVPSSCSLRVGRTGRQIRRYWQLEPKPGLVPAGPEAYAALRAIFLRQAERQLERRGGVAALLSGGLDSSTVVAVAAKVLERQGRTLTAVANISPDQDRDRFPDEREFVELFRCFPNLEIRTSTSETAGPFDWMDEPERFSGFFPPHPMLHAPFPCLEELRLSGAGVLLTGSGGEMGPSHSARRFLADSVLAGRFGQAFPEARQHARVYGGNAARAILVSFRNRYPHQLRPRSRSLIAPSFRRLFPSRTEPVPLFMDDVSHNRWAFNSLMKWQDLRPFRWFPPIPELRTLFDRSILEFCISAPGDVKHRDGYLRSLIRGATEGIVPDRIRWRTSKGPYLPNYMARYNAQLPFAREFVRAIGKSDPVRSAVDVDTLEKQMQFRAQHGKQVPGFLDAPTAIRLILFLRQFPEFRA